MLTRIAYRQRKIKVRHLIVLERVPSVLQTKSAEWLLGAYWTFGLSLL